MPYKFEGREIFGLGERGSGFKPRSLAGYQDFVKIKEQCLGQKIIFEDEQFPANDISIGEIESGGGPYNWKRAKDIESKPRFILGGADRFDVRQGELGNCWLLAAISDITLNKELFRVLVPKDNRFGKEYCGAFHFRFWQFGKWVDVVIDDRLPCNEDGKLAFLNPITPNEFWSPLLEKAYAKLNGSYAKLDGGYTLEALADFTGGFTEVIELEKLKDIDIADNEELFDILIRSFVRSSFMGTNVKETPGIIEDKMENGLIRGHAYSITDLRVIQIDLDGEKKNVRLFRMRNPWGTDAEWKGDWCDRSSMWKYVSEEDKINLKVTFEADGEFWMSYDDFLINIERIELCHMSPFTEEDCIEERMGRTMKQWVSWSLAGNWIRGVTAGGSYKYKGTTFANNPQYIMNIEEPGDQGNTVVICLLKKARKLEPEACDVSRMMFSIFPVTTNSPKPLNTTFFMDQQNTPIILPMNPIKTLREITVRLILKAGSYVIIPASYMPDSEGEYLLRVFTEGKSHMSLYDEEVSIQEDEVGVQEDTKEEKEHLENAQEFFKIVAGDDEEVNWWKLKLILDKSFHDEFQYEGFGFSEDVCRSIVALMDMDRSGKLGFYEFTNLWTQVISWKQKFNEYDTDHSNGIGTLKTHELRNALKAGGYVVNKDILEIIVLRYGDKNGEIALDKFILAALKLKTMIELYKRREDKDTESAIIKLNDWLAETIYA